MGTSHDLQLRFFSGVGSVTGANFLLENISKETPLKILIDCGLVQGTPTSKEENNAPFLYDPKSIDILVVTHAHADHIGRIPKLVKDGFRGKIYSTPETNSIAKIMLDDMLSILERKAREEGLLPMYEKADVATAFSLWHDLPYHTSLSLGAGITLSFKDAGHILGSAMCEFSYGKEKIVFTGDLGNSPTPLLKDTEDVTDATYLIMESVYGDRNHEPIEERRLKLKDAIMDSIAKKGTLIIPSFSIERTQVLLYEINNLVEDKIVPSIPVFVDSPLAIRVTEIYKGWKKNFNQGVQKEIQEGDDIFNFPKLKFTLLSNDSRHIEQVVPPKIILAGSGMSEGGRVVQHEKNYLPDPKNTVLLVGYQALGTLGRRLEEGAKEVFIHGEKVPVRASIKTISGYSSHKDSDHLIQFVEKTKETVKKVFVVMGEPKASLFLAQRLRDYIGVEALYPERDKTYVL